MAFSIQEKTELLRNSRIFSETSEHILHDMAGALAEKEVLKGAVVVRKGEAGDALFIIARGSVRIHDGNHVLARMERGGVFGEYSLLDNNTRSASVTAEENCVLLRLDRTDFYRIAMQNADILQGVLRALIQRMREMNALEEKLSKSYLKIRKQKDQIEKQNLSITRQKELLSQQNFDLTKLNEEKNQFLGMVIHQIKNPLTSSLCVLEMLDGDRERLTEVQVEGLEIIIKSLWRINKLINETLDVSAIESKVYEVKYEMLDLHQIINDILENYTYLLSQKEITMVTDVWEIRASMNRVYFTQIVDNLLSNAIKFTPSGKKITVTLIASAGKNILKVQDQGPGISEELISRIFHQYSRQTDMQSQNLPPLGLGLAIVHMYTVALNGTVICENCPEGGTCFTVEFPA